MIFKNSILNGDIAQLGDRLHGMQEVVGSIPTGSTNPTPRDFGSVAQVVRAHP